MDRNKFRYLSMAQLLLPMVSLLITIAIPLPCVTVEAHVLLPVNLAYVSLDGKALHAINASFAIIANFNFLADCGSLSNCNGHGSCATGPVCVCDGLWLGADCSQRKSNIVEFMVTGNSKLHILQ
jgi:hypothetical protein